MTNMKQSRKMYGCKLCKVLCTELHKVSSGNLRPTNLSIELHVEREHPGVPLDSVIDHITKFSKVSEARAVLSADGYDALLGPKATTNGSKVLSEISDSAINTFNPPVSKPGSKQQEMTDSTKHSPAKNATPRKSRIVILKVASPVLPTPPSSASQPSNYSPPTPRPSPLSAITTKIPAVPSKPKSKQVSKAKKNHQDWIKSLDRSGKPCRRWTRRPFQITSFTQYAFDLPGWQNADPLSEHISDGGIITASAKIKEGSARDGMANSSQAKTESEDILIEHENAFKDDLSEAKFNKIRRNTLKATSQDIEDSSSTEIGQSAARRKRRAPDQIEHNPVKKPRVSDDVSVSGSDRLLDKSFQ